MPVFEWDKYTSDYEGLNKVNRLLHIANVYPSIAGEVLKEAIKEIKNGDNVEHYNIVVQVCKYLYDFF